MNQVIGFTGKKGSGKDTAAAAAKSMLINEGFKVINVAFADPIRDQVAKTLGFKYWRDVNNTTAPAITAETMYNQHPPVFDWDKFKVEQNLGEKVNCISGRHLFREIGMLMRSYDEHQFVRFVEEKIDSAPDGTIVLITDVRFENEAEMIKRRKGKIIDVQPKYKEDRPYIMQTSGYKIDQHVTELGIDPKYVDATIFNDSQGRGHHSLFMLAADVSRTLRELGITSR